jgi:L-aminopeptidase/D-esterase-like protein
MVLTVRDAKPEGIAFVDAYTAIRSWFCYNANTAAAANARSLIAALPPSGNVSPVECKAVFAEVINGGLEWAYNQSDGRFNMSAYAWAALEAAGAGHTLTADDRTQLRSSPLWPFLSFNRNTSGI